MTTTIGIAVHEGAGVYHTPQEASQIARLVVVANALWILIVNITKASILSQYLRIFCARLTRTLTHLLFTALAVAALYALFQGIFLCQPVAKLWSPRLPGTCASAQTYWLSVAGLDISLDALVLLLPLPAIFSLRLPTRQKIALVALFALGFLVCAVAVARLLTVYLAAQRGQYVQSGVWAIVWSAVEANTGIVCACLLALKPLATRVFPGWFAEAGPPRHAMRLKRVDTSAARWSRCGGVSGGVPATPSSGVSGEKEGEGWSASRTAARGHGSGGQAWSELENLGVLERERGQGGQRDAHCERAGDGRMAGEDEDVSIWEMLRRPEEVVIRGQL